MSDLSHLGGYTPNPLAIQSDWARIGPPLAQAAPSLFTGDNDKDVFLYKAWKDVLGAYPSYDAQTIGDCTSQGGAHSVDLRACIEILLGEPEEFKPLSTECLYGAARRIANMLGNSDGCYGSAIARAVTEVGMVPREALEDSYSQGGRYSGKRAKEFGRTGMPSKYAEIAGRHKVGSAALVATLDELDAALANGYVSIICSNQGFSLQRDADGACRPQGSWAHCMLVAGRRTRNGQVQYLICNSWGDQSPTGPISDDQPLFSFWCDARTTGRILGQRDSYALGLFSGFPRRDLPKGWSYMSAA